jgi:hypothetical protein
MNIAERINPLVVTRESMKKFSVMTTAAFFLCATLLLAEEYSGPRIEIKELRHDFGKVVQGAQVSHVFEIRSAGKEALVIERVQSS